MMRFQTLVAGLLAPVLVLPVVLGQGQLSTLQSALSGTERALSVLHDLEHQLETDPAGALGLVLAATEEPVGDEMQRDQRLESLRNQVSLLQMELDSLQSPVLAPDGSVQSALGTRPPEMALEPQTAPRVTTGLDDSLRSLLSSGSESRMPARSEGGSNRDGTRTPAAHARPARDESAPETGGEELYSADPLRHGITCYRAGRYAEALQLLGPLDDATALYWQARTLERLERLDDAIGAMERAIAKGGEGFEQRRAQTDLEFLRWKRDFVQNLPKGEPK